MTIDEANQILHCPDIVGGVYSEKYGQALGVTMKALEQEPVYFPPCVDCNTKMNEIREAYDKLKNQSGLRWIERFDNEDKWLECPHCHTDSTEAYNYCPNCGADMRGGENETN